MRWKKALENTDAPEQEKQREANTYRRQRNHLVCMLQTEDPTLTGRKALQKANGILRAKESKTNSEKLEETQRRHRRLDIKEKRLERRQKRKIIRQEQKKN